MSKLLSEIEINEISSLAYLDIVQVERSDIAILYKLKNEVTMGAVIDYYLAQGEFEGNQEGPEYMKKRFSVETGEYEYWKEFLIGLDQSEDTDYRSWKISNIKSENKMNECGFVAYTIETAPGIVTVAFRGSEPLLQPNYLNDWETDCGFAYSKQTKQERLAKEYVQSLDEKVNIDRLYITGHSLGGHLGLYSAFSLPPKLEAKLVSCSVFGSPGFNKQVLKNNKEVISRLQGRGKIKEFQNKYDPVGSILYNPTQAVYINSTNPEANNFTNHSNFLLNKKLDQNGKPVFDYCEVQTKDTVCRLMYLVTTEFESLSDAEKIILVEMLSKIAEKALSRGEVDETFMERLEQQIKDVDSEKLEPQALLDMLNQEAKKILSRMRGTRGMERALSLLKRAIMLTTFGRQINETITKAQEGVAEEVVSTSMSVMMVDLEQLKILEKKMNRLQEQLKINVKNEMINKAQNAAKAASNMYSESEVSRISNSINRLCEHLNKEYNDINKELGMLEKDLKTTYNMYKQEEKDCIRRMSSR